ncbi:non-hydrolyzing UDP-N-acetylglucosamine 2-epimerase [Mesorhizobium sp. ZMM04-5]|uniref:UDP-N-acetylglucosamine 2-epimerase (non-hydrolyzing) n=1 Tax=Mesorhizobium marinum TaxID=3228790 RepID=A0ABV3QX83_9HYPH
MKVFVAIGTRPEAIKLAPVVAALRPKADVVVATTGQHPRLAVGALADFGIVPDLALPPIEGRPSLAQLTASMTAVLDLALVGQKPDWVVVQGDTNSAFAAGLAAYYRSIPVAHVEAGLRTGNLAMPFPEEGNRQMLARIARWHFAPTVRAAANLVSEGVDRTRVVMSGNTVVDAVALARAGRREEDWKALDAALALPDGPLVLVSCHRRENRGQTLLDICSAIRRLAARYPLHRLVLPMHPEPDVRTVFQVELAGVDNVFLREPFGYVETLHALDRCDLVLTDSGGLQEEVATYRKPVVVMRDQTERPEGIEAGFASLAGRDPDRIVSEVSGWLDDPQRRARLAGVANPYGDGSASRRIAETLLVSD